MAQIKRRRLQPHKTSTQSVSETQVAKTESEKANALFDQLFEESLSRYPQFLTALGRKTDNDKWNDLSEEFALEGYELSKRQLAKLNALDETKLDAQTNGKLSAL